MRKHGKTVNFKPKNINIKCKVNAPTEKERFLNNEIHWDRKEDRRAGKNCTAD